MSSSNPERLFLAAQSARRLYAERLAGGSGGTWWTAVVLTASSARQAQSYQSEIDHRRAQGALPSGVPFLVVPDPEGRRIGSGGATVHALHQLLDTLAPGLRTAGPEALAEWWGSQRVLMLHSGGDSRRLPQYSLSGKVFSALPVKTPWGAASTVFDETMALSSAWAERLPAGLLVGSGDVVLVFETEGLDWSNPGITGVAMPQPPEVGAQHGVYVVGPGGTVYSFLQKPALAEVEEAGGLLPGGRVAVDTGLLRFDPEVSARLTSMEFRGDNGDSLDLYTHLTLALTGQWAPAREAPKVQRALARLVQGVPFGCDLVEGEFTHVGTTTLFRHLLTEETDFLRLYNTQQRLGSAEQPGLDSSGVVIDSALAGGSVGPGAVVLECHLEHRLNAARGSVAHGLESQPAPVEVPENTVVHQVPVRGPGGTPAGTVIRCYGVEDNPKDLAGSGRATWFGVDLLKALDDLGLAPDEVWPDVPAKARCLWNADLFPATEPAAAWEAACWMMGQASGFNAARWRELPKASLATSAEWADQTRLLEQRTRRATGQWRTAATQLALDGADIRAMLTQAPGVSALAAVANRLSKFADEAADPSSAASLSYEASLFHAQAGLEPEAEESRSRAFAFVSKAVAMGARDSGFPVADGFRQRSVTVAAPVRIDFGGGWSDTPPFCLDWGGTVLNAAVSLNGDYPIETKVRLLEEPLVRCQSPEGEGKAEYSRVDELYAPPRPGDPYAIPRAVLQMSGLFEPGADLSGVLKRLGGGLEISTSVRLPMGSGLGTSSILAATVIQALAEMLGHRLSAQPLSDLVLQLEQFMSTGGGWQDQAGGIFPGVKLLSTGPGPRQRVRYQPVQWSLEREAELERLTVLAYTGVARVARNLLQQVVGRYLARETAAVQVLHSIKTLALEMSHAMQQGDWDHLGALLDRHWQLNQILDPNTTNAPVQGLLERVKPLIRGAKLAGAGGGGFFILLANSEAAAEELRSRVKAYDWQVAGDGLRVKRVPI